MVEDGWMVEEWWMVKEGWMVEVVDGERGMDGGSGGW